MFNGTRDAVSPTEESFKEKVARATLEADPLGLGTSLQIKQFLRFGNDEAFYITMNALVSYGSSSDEDESSNARDEPSKSNVHSASSNALPDDGDIAQPPLQSAKNGLNSSGPMVGPSRPDDAQQSLQNYEYEELPDLSQMTEREKLRYLTQPTHPMSNGLPPSPPGSPNAALNAKFNRFLELKAKGVHFNEDLARKSTFQNPNLLLTLMETAGVTGETQYQSSVPEDVFSPAMFPPSAFKEELLKSQQKLKAQGESERKELSAKGKRTIEFTSGGRSGTASQDSTPGLQAKRKKP